MASVKPPRKNISAENAKKIDDDRLKDIREDIKENNKVEFLVSSIKPPKFHDRRYIDKLSIVELSESIDASGLIYPIVIRELEDGTHERIIGYRRIEAYKILKKRNNTYNNSQKRIR